MKQLITTQGNHGHFSLYEKQWWKYHFCSKSFECFKAYELTEMLTGPLFGQKIIFSILMGNIEKLQSTHAIKPKMGILGVIGSTFIQGRVFLP